MRRGSFWILLIALGYSLHVQAGFTVTDTASTEISAGESFRDSVVCYALEYLGTPYRYGGRSPKGFDCSGFANYVFEAFDICLERTSRFQAREGKEVDLEFVQKGDLLIFTGRNAKARTPGHVGIVISDKGEPLQFVHASSSRSGGIKVSDLDGWYKVRFLTARNVIDH